jgi:MFS family permease
MALSNVSLFGGAFLAPVLVGKVTHSLRWEWSFYFLAIFSGAALPFLFSFVPETAFRRADRLNTDFGIDVEQNHMLSVSGLEAGGSSKMPINKVFDTREVGKENSPSQASVCFSTDAMSSAISQSG